MGVWLGGGDVTDGVSVMEGTAVGTGAIMPERGTGPVGVLTAAGGNGLAVGEGGFVGGALVGRGEAVAVGQGFGVLVYSRVAVAGGRRVGVGER